MNLIMRIIFMLYHFTEKIEGLQMYICLSILSFPKLQCLSLKSEIRKVRSMSSLYSNIRHTLSDHSHDKWSFKMLEQ